MIISPFIKSFFINILFVYVILNTATSNAQSKKDTIKKVFDEFSISYNSSMSYYKNTKNKKGFGLAVYKKINLDNSSEFLTGLEFNQNHQFKKFEEGGQGYNLYDITYKINYLSVPFLYRYHLGAKVKLTLEVGIKPAIEINSTKKGRLEFINPQIPSSSFGGDANLKQFDLGIITGTGIVFPILSRHLIVTIDYNYNFIELSEVYEEFIRNNSLRLAIGLKI